MAVGQSKFDQGPHLAREPDFGHASPRYLLVKGQMSQPQIFLKFETFHYHIKWTVRIVMKAICICLKKVKP